MRFLAALLLALVTALAACTPNQGEDPASSDALVQPSASPIDDDNGDDDDASDDPDDDASDDPDDDASDDPDD